MTILELELQWRVGSWTKKSWEDNHFEFKDKDGNHRDPSVLCLTKAALKEASHEEYDTYKAVEGIPGYWRSRVRNQLIAVCDGMRDNGQRLFMPDQVKEGHERLAVALADNESVSQLMHIDAIADDLKNLEEQAAAQRVADEKKAAEAAAAASQASGGVALAQQPGQNASTFFSPAFLSSSNALDFAGEAQEKGQNLKESTCSRFK